MTAPPVTTPQGSARPVFQRRRTGATGSSGGDGGYGANGVMNPPGQGLPGDATTPSPGILNQVQNGGGTNTNTQHPPAAQHQNYQSGMGGGQGGQGGQTFAQMSANGNARPAPQQLQQQQSQAPADVGSALQSSVLNALQNGGSRYGLPQVQQVSSALQQQLSQQFGAQQKQLDEEMARRGLGASSIAAGYNGDLGGQQATAMANMNAQLLQNYAATQAGDQSAALGAAQNYQTGQLNQTLGLGNLGIAQGSLTGNYGGQSTLAAQQLAQQGSQFNQTQNQQNNQFLQSLGLQQTAQTNQSNQFNQQLGFNQQQLAQQGAQSTADRALQQLLGLGSQGIQQQQVTNQQSQFNASQLQQNQQFATSTGLQQQQLDISKKAQDAEAAYQAGEISLGARNAAVAEAEQKQQALNQNATLAQQGTQFTATQTQQNQQFQDQLAQALKTATMSDATQNRAIDVQGQTQGTQMLMQLLQILGPNTDWSSILGKVAGQGYKGPVTTGTGGTGDGGIGGTGDTKG